MRAARFQSVKTKMGAVTAASSMRNFLERGVGNGASASYLRQTIINCCQLLPEWGIIRVSKEPHRVSKGHWKNQQVPINTGI